MAAERQSEAPFGGKACPESPAPAGHSGRALRLHGSGAVGALPRPCCATPGGGFAPPLRARAAPAPERVGRVGSPRAGFRPPPARGKRRRGFRSPRRRFGSMVGRPGRGLLRSGGGRGLPALGRSAGLGRLPRPGYFPAPRLRSPACLRCSGALCASRAVQGRNDERFACALSGAAASRPP